MHIDQEEKKVIRTGPSRMSLERLREEFSREKIILSRIEDRIFSASIEFYDIFIDILKAFKSCAISNYTSREAEVRVSLSELKDLSNLNISIQKMSDTLLYFYPVLANLGIEYNYASDVLIMRIQATEEK